MNALTLFDKRNASLLLATAALALIATASAPVALAVNAPAKRYRPVILNIYSFYDAQVKCAEKQQTLQQMPGENNRPNAGPGDWRDALSLRALRLMEGARLPIWHSSVELGKWPSVESDETEQQRQDNDAIREWHFTDRGWVNDNPSLCGVQPHIQRLQCWSSATDIDMVWFDWEEKKRYNMLHMYVFFIYIYLDTSS